MVFAYTRDIDSDCPKMMLDKHIGDIESSGMGIDGSVFSDELIALQSMGKKRVDIWINSPGGSVFEGFKIYSAILHSNMAIDTYCMGLCASMAANIFQSGRKRYMVDFGKLMFHGTRGSDDATFSKEMTDSCAKMVAARCGKSLEATKAIMTKKDVWLGANESLIEGMCDSILSSSDANIGRIAKISSDTDLMYKEAASIMGQMLKEKSNTQNKDKMEGHEVKVKDLKPLYDEVSLIEGMEVSKIVDVVKDIKAKLNSANETAKLFQDEKNALLKEKAELNEEVINLKAKIGGIEKAAQEELKKAQRESSSAMLKAYQETGKLKGDEATLNKWLENCEKLGAEEVKAMIEELPINKEGASLTKTKEKDKEGNVLVETNAASKMGELQARINKQYVY